jgi:hypothetical protein
MGATLVGLSYTGRYSWCGSAFLYIECGNAFRTGCGSVFSTAEAAAPFAQLWQTRERSSHSGRGGAFHTEGAVAFAHRAYLAGGRKGDNLDCGLFGHHQRGCHFLRRDDLDPREDQWNLR